MAIRLGDVVYHWQNEDDGLLRLSRRDAEDFLYEYAVLENRTLHRSRVAISPETFSLLRDAFQRRWLDESVAVDGLAARRADRELVEALQRANADAAASVGAEIAITVPVAAAGLFADGAAAGESGVVEPALVALAERVAREHGDGFAAARAAALRARLEASLPERLARPAAAPPEGADPWLPQGGVARAVGDDAAGAFALEVLDEARPLRSAERHGPRGDAWTLADAERAALARWADRLEADLAARAAADRPDWGTALLVGMARLAALRQSVASGRLVVVDAYPDGAVRVSGARLERYRDLLPAVLAEAQRELAAARRRFVETRRPGERAWAEVETAANRAAELERVLAGGDGLRVAPGPMTPSRRADVAVAVPPLPHAFLAGRLEAAERAELDWIDEVERRFGYRLLTRNCATEVFRVIDDALASAAPPGGAVEAEWADRLGGRVGAEEPLHFIPFRTFDAVRERWRVVDEREIPSLGRRARAAAVRDGGALAALREASPLTSRLGGLARRDSFFLFYTEDVPALRPVLGAANLAAGVGAAAAGVALAPLDGGDTLVAGLRGVLFSVPELAFVGIRKGAYEWVPAALRPDEIDPVPAAETCAAAPPRGRTVAAAGAVTSGG